ncbi:MAG: sn-glycerol-3-phosphate ABC transporter ATP-binding protein UgpC [Rhizobiaceae bacterium]|nr:sn-glycerol-3-phosphate ABC transporter ATP-binding protein UgpC [Rhizobiaceae bacterium]
MAIVKLDQLGKTYGKVVAVSDVNMTIGDGEFMVLLGPSGCGKSTTLRMIAGLENITEGELSIDGQRMNAVPAKNRDIAMVFQSYALYPHMSVRDNLGFGLKRRQTDKAVVRKRVDEVAASIGLTEYLDRKPHALSGGQRQRVALGRAIVRDPKVFLFDEPLSNLDAALRVSTRAELVRLHRELKATMIYVTHDQVEAMTMGDRVCIMNNGKVAQIGSPMEVYLNPASTFVASFLGNPPMNLVPATTGEGVVESGSGRIAQNGFQPGRKLVLGLRPEDLCPTDKVEDAVVSGRVTSLESLGAETLVHIDTGGTKPVILRGGRNIPAQLDQTLHLTCDPAMARYFDAETGVAIIPGEQQ